jgi:hypothetical protein
VGFAYGFLKDDVTISGFSRTSSIDSDIHFFGAWLSLVERLVRDQEVRSSNLRAPTNSSIPMNMSPKLLQFPISILQAAEWRFFVYADCLASYLLV